MVETSPSCAGSTPRTSAPRRISSRMTSTCIGIIEGKRIRRQIETMDLLAPRKRDPGKQDRLGKLYEAAMKRAQQKREQQGRRFKERD